MLYLLIAVGFHGYKLQLNKVDLKNTLVFLVAVLEVILLGMWSAILP